LQPAPSLSDQRQATRFPMKVLRRNGGAEFLSAIKDSSADTTTPYGLRLRF
jgi:hypothetical protein